jgi:hypothetical protein
LGRGDGRRLLRFFDLVHCGAETVAAFRDGFDIPRLFRRIAQGLSESGNGYVQSVLEIDECVLCPKALPEFVARYQRPWVFEQRRQNLEWLTRQLDLDVVLAKDRFFQVGLEGPEPDKTSFWTV